MRLQIGTATKQKIAHDAQDEEDGAGIVAKVNTTGYMYVAPNRKRAYQKKVPDVTPDLEGRLVSFCFEDNKTKQLGWYEGRIETVADGEVRYKRIANTKNVVSNSRAVRVYKMRSDSDTPSSSSDDYEDPWELEMKKAKASAKEWKKQQKAAESAEKPRHVDKKVKTSTSTTRSSSRSSNTAT